MLTTFPNILILIIGRTATYYETLARNQTRKIKARQISPAAAATLLKEREAFRTTINVIGVVLLCYLPKGLFRAVFVHLISSPESFLVTLMLCNSVLILWFFALEAKNIDPLLRNLQAEQTMYNQFKLYL